MPNHEVDLENNYCLNSVDTELSFESDLVSEDSNEAYENKVAEALEVLEHYQKKQTFKIQAS